MIHTLSSVNFFRDIHVIIEADNMCNAFRAASAKSKGKGWIL